MAPKQMETLCYHLKKQIIDSFEQINLIKQEIYIFNSGEESLIKNIFNINDQ